MSKTTWKKINNFWTRNVENQFVQSGYGMIDDYLDTTPRTEHNQKIVNDMEIERILF